MVNKVVIAELDCQVFSVLDFGVVSGEMVVDFDQDVCDVALVARTPDFGQFETIVVVDDKVKTETYSH